MTSTRRSRGIAAAAAGATLALALAACTPPPEDDGATGDSGGEERELPEDCDEAYAQYGDLTGTNVSVYTSIDAPEDEVQIASYEEYERCTGATIDYEGSDEFEAQLPVRLQSGNAPDIAYIPQPGLLQRLVEDFPDQVQPAPESVEANVDEYFTEAWRDYGSVDGTLYASPLGANVKSFVWYSPSMFEEAGYEIPETWEELMDLSDQIVADGNTPWCAGIGSGDATGWPATDWLEDVLLRTAGPEFYDQWVAHEVPFDSPEVVEALNTVGEVLKNPDYVNAGIGGVESIATTEFNDAGFPILDGECWMHRQANFYQSNWASYQEDAVVGEDGDVFAFYLPAMEGSDEKPLLGGGEFVTSFSDRNEVQQFMTFLSSPEWANEKAAIDVGWMSANQGLDPSLLPSPIDQLSVELLSDEEYVFRFDGSDLMPGPVGAGSFWTEMVNWIASDKATEDVLSTIEQSWPADA